MSITVEMAFDAQNVVGESVVWDDRTETLHWVDIVGRRIHTLAPATGRHQSWETPEIVTSIGLRKDGGAIVGLAKTIARWEFDGAFSRLAEVESDMPGNRLNEGVVGPDGAFWVGTMQNNIEPDGSPKDITAATGHLYRVTADGTVDRLSNDRFGITNSLVWTANGRLITADTLENTLYSYACDPDTGRLSDRKTIQAAFDRGLPDGSCIDAEGYIWNCRVVGGDCLLRLDPEGRIDRVVELPCSWPTSCAFAGPDLDRLYVTSARFTMDADHLASAPQEGALFKLDVGVRGRPANRFG
ncbi:MAG: SMP-30/gluconolactonase/LRE family protein [Geminicoccaceae bacterium]